MIQICPVHVSCFVMFIFSFVHVLYMSGLSGGLEQEPVTVGNLLYQTGYFLNSIVML